MFNLSRDKAVFWVLLTAPAVWMLVRWASDADPWLADYVADTGLWSARLIIAALCLTPLKLLLGSNRWINWLIAHRRAVGVAAFFYALLHLILYLVDMSELDAVLAEATIPSMVAGWLAMAALVPPALTSSNRAMKELGRGWKRVQRFAYPAAIITLVHWALVHDGFIEALLHFLPLAILQLLRLAKGMRTNSHERITT